MNLLKKEYCGQPKMFPPVIIAWIPIYISYHWPVAAEPNS